MAKNSCRDNWHNDLGGDGDGDDDDDSGSVMVGSEMVRGCVEPIIVWGGLESLWEIGVGESEGCCCCWCCGGMMIRF